jgi:hypothetical protein
VPRFDPNNDRTKGLIVKKEEGSKPKKIEDTFYF